MTHLHRKSSTIYVNGQRHEIHGEDNFLMVAEWLRKTLGRTGTKIVCAEGDCGACTVLKADTSQSCRDFTAINSCIALVSQMDTCSLVTIEGIAVDGALSPAQEAMATCHGSQCGFCTPGFVMAISGLLESHKTVSPKTAANYLTGNLCRCTGYQSIIDAASTAKYSASHDLGDRYLTPAIQNQLSQLRQKSLEVKTSSQTFFAPTDLEAALRLLAAHKEELRILGAATDLGVQYNKGKDMPSKFLSLHLIDNLAEVSTENGRITVGARATLERVREVCKTRAPEFSRLLNVFASPQIKNSATLVGNIANGSPIGDSMPYLLVADCYVHTSAWRGDQIVRRTVALTDFYLGYKQTALKSDELITHVSFAAETGQTLTQQKRFCVRTYKVSARRDLDISAVSAAFHFTIGEQSHNRVIEGARIALGGVAATPIRATVIEASLLGQMVTPELIKDTAEALAASVKPFTDLRASAAYRRLLVQNLFTRFAREELSAGETQGGTGA